MRMSAGDYELDDDPGRVDADAAVAFLTTQAYWGRWRDAQDIKGQIAAAWRVVGVYDRAGAMIGFARAWGDGGCAYLSDVYVLPEHRGDGLGQAIVRMMIDDGPGAAWRWMLHTSDAHGLYRQFGFAWPSYRYLERPPQGEVVAPTHRAAAETLVGKVVRLEPLQHQHVAGLLAAAAPGGSRTGGPAQPHRLAPRRQPHRLAERRRVVSLVRGAAGRGPGPPVRRDGSRGLGRRNGPAVRRGPYRGRHRDRLDPVLRLRLLGLAGRE